MPLYEYVCASCGWRFSWLMGVVATPIPPTCPRCSATKAEKLAVSRFATVRAQQFLLDNFAPMDLAGSDDPADPSVMQQWSKQLGEIAGDSHGLGDDFDDYIDAAADARSSGAQELEH